MDTVIRILVIIASSAAVSLLVVWLAHRSLDAIARRRADRTVWELLHRCRWPLGITIFTALLLGGAPTVHRQLGADVYGAVHHLVLLVLIAALGWLIARVVIVASTASYNRYAATAADRARVRRLGTRLTMIRRVAVAAIGVMAVATMLLTFPGVRAVGASMLASAGIVGIVAGVAAQSSLGNLFAGLQLAFSDQVRIGDVVVVDGQYGTIEEITLSYIVLAAWDERRIVMPISYFASQPYENWTRGDPRMTGAVFFELDHRAPVAELRAELKRLLEGTALWDGRSWSLVVYDTTPSTMQVRAVVSARDADDLFTLRCQVRERLLEFLVREHPYGLPRVATGPAAAAPAARTAAPAEEGAAAGGGGADLAKDQHHRAEPGGGARGGGPSDGGAPGDAAPGGGTLRDGGRDRAAGDPDGPRGSADDGRTGGRGTGRGVSLRRAPRDRRRG